jgi:hypothetical protein
LIVIFLYLILLAVPAAGQDRIQIKSLRAHSGDELQIPIVTEENNLIIEFDVQASYQPHLNIVFRFCDRNWRPTNNIFLNNYGKNIAYDLDYVVLPSTIQEARYRFRGVFPNRVDFVDFPYSGKWRYYITDGRDTSKVYAEGKFYVVFNDIEVRPAIKRGLLEDRVYSPLALGRIFEISASFDLPEEFFPGNVMQAEIVENFRINRPFIIDRGFNTTFRQFYWDGNRNMRFQARDVRPGNENRQTNLMNVNKYSRKDVPANLEDQIELSRFNFFGRRDLDGGFNLMNYKNEYADYLNVTFRIRPPYESFGDIFITGSFNNWELSPEYRMIKQRGGEYAITLSLKRGVYDYQYVAAELTGDLIKNEDWYVLEGNFWETSNNYHIFIYYNDPNFGGYDRIIGYTTIKSNER